MALIEAGLIQQLENDLEMNVSYDGTVHNYSELLPSDDPDYRGMKRPKFASAVTQSVSAQVYAHAVSGKMVLTLGGDHSIAIGTISGTAKAVRERLGREIAVIWVDAHADINTPETSDSGNIHGMPVSFLTGLAKEGREDVFGWIKEEHLLSTKKLVYIGLRDIDKGEKKILREHGIKAFSMHDVDRYVEAEFCGIWGFTNVGQTWHWQDYGYGTGLDRHGYAYSSVVRYRCAGSYVCA
jgi:arginase